ncbi:histidine phosphatase family protein [Kribbella sp. NPDC003505]|uniref:histidine phosphatase family protein n=1 Tax=Kribbella sp. NPDC003505 TaxID=3154448 RepID=UPI0033B2CCA1
MQSCCRSQSADAAADHDHRSIGHDHRLPDGSLRGGTGIRISRIARLLTNSVQTAGSRMYVVWVLILVRHAMPAHGPDTPARDWALAPEGQVAARSLCGRLPTGARLVASSEPKAIASLGPAGNVVQDPRFDEISRAEVYGETFREQRRAYVDGADHIGWEARDDVIRRFEAGVVEHIAAADGRPVVIASHGMAMTLWLTAAVGLDDPGAFWADLRFPDAHVVDIVAGKVVRFLRP